MKNSLWKLTALAGVVGIVMLAFLQAQHGGTSHDPDEFVPANPDEFAAPDLGESASSAEAFASIPSPEPGSFAVDDPSAIPASPPADAVSPPATDEFAPDLSLPPDPWATEPSDATESAAPPDDASLTRIRRRDALVQPASGEVQRAIGERSRERVPEILQLGGEEARPLVTPDDEADEFGPDLFRETPSEPLPPGLEPQPVESARNDFSQTEESGSDDSEEPLGLPPELDDFPRLDDEESADLDARDELAQPTPIEGSDEFEPLEPTPASSSDPEPLPDLEPVPDVGVPGSATIEEDDPFDLSPAEEPEPIDIQPLRDPEPIEALPDPAFDRANDALESDSVPLRLPSESAHEPEPANPPRSEFRIQPGTVLEPEPASAEADVPRLLDESPSSPEPERVAPEEDVTRIERADLIGEATLEPSSPVVAQKPRITIEKIAPEVALLGKPLVYTIVVRNVGETPAQKVVVEDRIPKGTELTGTIPRAEFVDKLLRWNLGTVAPGETKKIAVRVTPISEGQIGSIATVNFVASVGARTKITSPQLVLTMSGPERVALGKPVGFQFDIENSGSGHARSVVLRNLVPAGLHHPGGDDLEYAVGDMAPGERKTVRLSMTARQVGEVVNRAVASAEGGLESEARTSVRIVGSSLSVSRTGPAKRYVGRTAQFSNVVTNNGDAPLGEVTVIETLPDGVEFVEAGSGGQFNATRREIAWLIPRLGPKESTVLKVKLVSRSAGQFTSSVAATSNSGQTATVEAVTNAIGFTSLGLDIEGGGPPVFVGDTVTFKIAATNRGTSNAGNVAVAVAVSPELELVKVDAPVKYSRSGDEIRFAAVPTLGGRATANYELEFRAITAGDGRIRARITADDLSKPLEQDESVRVVGETP